MSPYALAKSQTLHARSALRIAQTLFIVATPRKSPPLYQISYPRTLQIIRKKGITKNLLNPHLNFIKLTRVFTRYPYQIIDFVSSILRVDLVNNFSRILLILVSI